jgi:hypothetical protein
VGAGVYESHGSKETLENVHFTCGRTEGGWPWPLGQTHHGLWPIKAKRTPCLVSVHTQSSSLPSFISLSVSLCVSVCVLVFLSVFVSAVVVCCVVLCCVKKSAFCKGKYKRPQEPASGCGRRKERVRGEGKEIPSFQLCPYYFYHGAEQLGGGQNVSYSPSFFFLPLCLLAVFENFLALFFFVPLVGPLCGNRSCGKNLASPGGNEREREREREREEHPGCRRWTWHGIGRETAFWNSGRFCSSFWIYVKVASLGS